MITNTSIIIGTGSAPLSDATILCDINHDTTIYLLGDDAGNNLNISFGSYDINYDGDLSADNPGCVIYCQNTACDYLITTSPLFCDPTDDIGTTKCSFFSRSPTNSPTAIPTINPTTLLRRSTLNLLNFLDDFTRILASFLAGVAIILIIISYFCRKKKGYDYSNTNTDNSDDNVKLVNSVDYVSGYGKNASHLAILFILFQIFDLYTDVSYLVYLAAYNFNQYKMFYIFLSSMVLSIFANVVVAWYFLNHELENKQFKQWYDEKMGIVLSLVFLFVFTDVSMITTVFTSQIFGLTLFFAPMSLKGINMVQIATIVSIFIEHVPQLYVQFYIIFADDMGDFSVVQMGTLIVSCFDILFSFFKAGTWIVSWKHNQKSRHSMYPQNEKTHLLRVRHSWIL